MEEEKKGIERRNAPRVSLTAFCPVSFDYKGRPYSGMMLNLSSTGAGFRLSGSNDPKLILNDYLSMTVKTGYGESIFKGKVKWSGKFQDFYSWGVEFTVVSNESSDPLRSLIDSFF